MSRPRVASVPTWTWIAPILGSGLLALTFAQVVPAAATLVLLLDAIALGASVFAAVSIMPKCWRSSWANRSARSCWLSR